MSKLSEAITYITEEAAIILAPIPLLSFIGGSLSTLAEKNHHFLSPTELLSAFQTTNNMTHATGLAIGFFIGAMISIFGPGINSERLQEKFAARYQRRFSR